MPKLRHTKVAASRPKSAVMASLDLASFYSPGRGIGYSVVIHAVLLTVVQLWAIIHIPPPPPIPEEVSAVMWLPTLGGGEEGGGDGSESSDSKPSAAPTSGTEGLVFPGPQWIHTDSPLPTNSLQTLLQPDLKDLPILDTPLDLPNLLSMPEVGVITPPEPVELAVEPLEEPAEPEAPPPVDVPEPVEVAEEVPPEPAPPEPVQAELEDLPILQRPVESTLPMPEPVPVPEPVEVAVTLPDTVEPPLPEEPEPVDPPDGEAPEPLVVELEDLPILSHHLDVPDSLSLPDPVLAPPPEPPELTSDPVEPEEPEPVEVPEEETPEPVQAELEDLPILNRTPDRLPLPEVAPPPPEPVELAVEKPPEETAEPEETARPEEQPPVDPPAEVAPHPALAQLQDLPIAKRTSLLNILALSPTPTPTEVSVEIPAAESLGRFAISPKPNLDTSETEPGIASAVALGDPTVGAAVDNEVSGDLASIVNISFGPGGTGHGDGSGSGGDGDSGTGSGLGSGTGAGAGVGPGSGTGSGSGSGAGSGPGGGPFAGISIVGGAGTVGASGPGTDTAQGSLAGITLVGGLDGIGNYPDSVVNLLTPPPVIDNYGQVSVTSTESNGGGLPYFGVFDDHQIRTVYLDMREEETDTTPLWTLEFACARRNTD